MNLVTHLSHNRVLLSILLPVLGAGLAISVLCLSFLTPPLITHLRNSTNGHLLFTSNTALNLCEDRLKSLAEVGLDRDPEIVAEFKNQILQEISGLGKQLHEVHLAVLDEHGAFLASSVPVSVKAVVVPRPAVMRDAITMQRWGDETVRVHMRYVPAWRWTVASFISQQEYTKPIRAAQRVVYVGTFGVLGTVILALFAAFYAMVKVPLRHVVRATQNVAEGRLRRLRPTRGDEIGQLALAFDSMVDSLEQNQERIRAIMSQLRESEQQYRLVTEHSLANIAMIQGGKVIFANTRAIETAGFRHEKFAATDLEHIVHPEDRAWVLEKIAGLEQGAVPREHFEFRCVTRNNEIYWQEMLAVSVTYKGRPAVLGHAIDITARKQSEKEQEKLEAALQEAKKMEAVGTLAGGIAHDFNNLLQAIHGYAEVLLLRARDNCADRRELEHIIGAARRGRELIRQLLTFGRKIETQLQPVDVNAQIAEVRELLDRTIPKTIKIETDLADDVRRIKGDPVQIQRVLINLVLNAKDAMPQGGTLSFRTKSVVLNSQYGRTHPDMNPGRYVALTVTDTGCGMEPSIKEHIFEPFFTTKVPGQGTGLGLSMVYGTIRNWGGAISCTSQPGQGTAFEILLPTVEHPDLPEQPPPDEALAEGTETILLVDDEPLIRDLGKTMLSMVGYTVLTAGNGKQALEMYKKCKDQVALVILDVIMPEMGGTQCLEALLTIDPCVKVLLASGYHNESNEFDEVINLAKGFLTKPYEMQKILAAVRETIDSD